MKCPTSPPPPSLLFVLAANERGKLQEWGGLPFHLDLFKFQIRHMADIEAGGRTGKKGKGKEIQLTSNRYGKKGVSVGIAPYVTDVGGEVVTSPECGPIRCRLGGQCVKKLPPGIS